MKKLLTIYLISYLTITGVAGTCIGKYDVNSNNAIKKHDFDTTYVIQRPDNSTFITNILLDYESEYSPQGSIIIQRGICDNRYIDNNGYRCTCNHTQDVFVCKIPTHDMQRNISPRSCNHVWKQYNYKAMNVEHLYQYILTPVIATDLTNIGRKNIYDRLEEKKWAFEKLMYAFSMFMHECIKCGEIKRCTPKRVWTTNGMDIYCTECGWTKHFEHIFAWSGNKHICIFCRSRKKHRWVSYQQKDKWRHKCHCYIAGDLGIDPDDIEYDIFFDESCKKKKFVTKLCDKGHTSVTYECDVCGHVFSSDNNTCTCEPGSNQTVPEDGKEESGGPDEDPCCSCHGFNKPTLIGAINNGCTCECHESSTTH